MDDKVDNGQLERGTADPPEAPPPPSHLPVSVRELPAILLEDDPWKEKRHQKALEFAIVSAIEKSNLVLLKELIDAGVDVNATILFTETPLIHAIQQDPVDPDIIKALLTAGCDINLPFSNVERLVPLHVVAARGDVDIACLLCEGKWESSCKVDAQCNGGATPLHFAVKHHHYRMVLYLLSQGADAMALDDQHRSCLHRACEADDTEMAQILLTHNVDVNCSDRFGWTPAFHSAFFQQKEMMEILIANGADLRRLDIFGNSVLHYACVDESVLTTSKSNNPVRITMATALNYFDRTRLIPSEDLHKLINRRKMQRYCESDFLLDFVKLLVNAGAGVHTYQGVDSQQFDVFLKVRVYLVLAGAFLRWDDPLLVRPHETVPGWLVQWFGEQVSRQHNLKRQCRRAIRDYLAPSRDISKAVEQLGLPRVLLEYLQLTEFSDVIQF